MHNPRLQEKKTAPHHLLYDNYLRKDEEAFTIPLCDWHHKLITKTAFIKTMDKIFDDAWASYRQYITERDESRKKTQEELQKRASPKVET